MARRTDNDTLIRYGLIAAGLFIASEAVGLFTPDPVVPGVPPAPPIGQSPTLSAPQLAAMAQGIRDAFQEFWGGENEPYITSTLLLCGNDADVATIINLYGTVCFNFNLFNCLTLPGSIAAYFSGGERATLNAGLAAKGINFQF